MSHQLKVLLDYKEDLVSALKDADLVDLSEELFKSWVISKDDRTSFTSLDHDRLDSRLRARYLVQCICGNVKQDDEIFHKFLVILAGMGENHVCQNLSAKLSKCMEVKGSDSENQSTGDACEALKEEIFLSDKDIQILINILAEVTFKWDVIGISLGLPMAVIKECECGSNNAMRLYTVLWNWISGKYPHAKSSTLSNLKQELGSPLVGLGKLASTLERMFSVAKKPLNLHEVKQPCLDSTPTILYQSSDTEVADGKSTLLEVQRNPKESVSYQWMKDGQSLFDSLVYSNVHNDILVIGHACQGVEGKYTCCVSIGNEQVNSRSVIVKVVFPPEKEHLMKMYLKQREIPRDTWPPITTSTFINLVPIKQNEEITCDHDYSVRGDMDDILKRKEKVEFEQVFGKYIKGGLVLVEGRSGCGKTTLVHKVARDWATRGDVLAYSKMVFLVPLRVLNSKKNDHTLSLTFFTGINQC